MNERNPQYGNRKHVYLFVVDENRVVTNVKERKLVGLSPDFVAKGQFSHCAKELVLFFLKKGFCLWNLPASYFFAAPVSLRNAHENFSKNFDGQLNGKPEIP